MKETLIEYVANNMFGESTTFREGQIGTWKKYFSKKNIEQFKKATASLLVDLNYEKDNNW